jgi:hypothetical protein
MRPRNGDSRVLLLESSGETDYIAAGGWRVAGGQPALRMGMSRCRYLTSISFWPPPLAGVMSAALVGPVRQMRARSAPIAVMAPGRRWGRTRR